MNINELKQYKRDALLGAFALLTERTVLPHCMVAQIYVQKNAPKPHGT